MKGSDERVLVENPATISQSSSSLNADVGDDWFAANLMPKTTSRDRGSAHGCRI